MLTERFGSKGCRTWAELRSILLNIKSQIQDGKFFRNESRSSQINHYRRKDTITPAEWCGLYCSPRLWMSRTQPAEQWTTKLWLHFGCTSRPYTVAVLTECQTFLQNVRPLPTASSSDIRVPSYRVSDFPRRNYGNAPFSFSFASAYFMFIVYFIIL